MSVSASVVDNRGKAAEPRPREAGQPFSSLWQQGRRAAVNGKMR